MTRHGELFDAVCAFENLALAARRAQAGKRYRPGVLAFNHQREDALHRLSRSLREGTWCPAPHRHFLIRDPKVRWISAAPYEDRVVHHALCNVIEPLIDRRLVFDCWANRKGKGSHRAVLRYQQFTGAHAYALKVDLCKYFPSIDHAILKDQIGRIFKDRRLLALMNLLVDHGQVPEPHDAYFPGDDLFTPFERPKGLPIGNLTSQVWANLYLNDFDHWVKEHLRCRAYVRFVDDFILLSDSKEQLHDWRTAIVERLQACRLQAHPRKSVILRTDEGVPFLGYVVWPGQIRVRGETVRRFRRRLRRRARGGRGPERRQSLAAWKGHIQLAGGWRRVDTLA